LPSVSVTICEPSVHHICTKSAVTLPHQGCFPGIGQVQLSTGTAPGKSCVQLMVLLQSKAPRNDSCSQRYRRRGDLKDESVLALVDASFAYLDLSGCCHIRPRTLVRSLEQTRMLLKLDVSGCNVTNAFVYSLPSTVPHLQLLRLGGVSASSIDFSAWKLLIPELSIRTTPESWEDHVADNPRCVRAHLLCLVFPFSSWQNSVSCAKIHRI
jgi:hypothetical protein